MNNTKLSNLINLYGGNDAFKTDAFKTDAFKINNLENMIENDSNTSEYVVDLLEIFDSSSDYEGGKGKLPKFK
jgi:hypothetical protein